MPRDVEVKNIPKVKLQGYDSTNAVWRDVLVDSTGKLIITI